MSNVKRLSPRDFASTGSVADPQFSKNAEVATYLKKQDGRSYVVWADLVRGDIQGEVEIPVKFPHAFGSGVSQLTDDGECLYYVTRSGGISRIHRDKRETQCIYSGRGVSNISLSQHSGRIAAVIFGDRVAVFESDECDHGVTVSEHPRALSLLQNLPASLSKFIVQRPDFVSDVCISDDGSRVVWHEWALPDMAWQRSQLSMYDFDANGDSIVSVFAGGDYFVSQPRFSPDPDKIAFLAEAGGHLRLWVADLAQWSASLVVDEQFEHGGPPWGNGNRTFDFSADGRQLIFSRNEAGFGRLVSSDLTGGHTREIAKAHHFAIHSSQRSLLAVRSGSKTPNCIVSYQLDTRERTILARSFSEKFHHVSAVEPILGMAPYSESFHPFLRGRFLDALVASPDMPEVPYRLYRPEPEPGTDFPTLITFHGGPTDQATVTFSTRNLAFLQAGFQVVSFDYRGSTGWGKQFREAIRGGFGATEIIDMLSVLSALDDGGWLGSKALIVNGGSSGGYSALRSLCVTAGLFDGAIASYPLIDLVASQYSTHRLESRYFDFLLGKLPDQIALYRERSIAADEVDDVPLLIMQGDNDPVVNYHQVVDFVAALEHLKRQVEFGLFVGEGHGFSAPESIETEFEMYETFLSRFIDITTARRFIRP